MNSNINHFYAWVEAEPVRSNLYSVLGWVNPSTTAGGYSSGTTTDIVISSPEFSPNYCQDKSAWEVLQSTIREAKRDLYPPSRGNYPPKNVFILPDQTLVFEYALAGFSPDNISIEFGPNTMYVRGTPPAVNHDGEKPGVAPLYLKRGIKLQEFETEELVPDDVYDIDRATSVWSDGVLTVKVPVREERKPKTLKITRA